MLFTQWHLFSVHSNSHFRQTQNDWYEITTDLRDSECRPVRNIDQTDISATVHVNPTSMPPICGSNVTRAGSRFQWISKNYRRKVETDVAQRRTRAVQRKYQRDSTRAVYYVPRTNCKNYCMIERFSEDVFFHYWRTFYEKVIHRYARQKIWMT